MGFRENFRATQAQMVVNDLRTPSSVLAKLAAEYPELRVAIAMHPMTSDDLLAWLDEQGDDVVSDVVAERRASPGRSLMPPPAIFGIPLPGTGWRDAHSGRAQPPR
jgi:hypothetical protein